MQHREHDNRLIRCPKVNGVGEGVQQRSANFARHGGKLEWSLADARERSVDIAEEPLGEPGSLVLVPPRGILEIGLSEWPNDEPAAHSISVAAVELLAEPFLNNIPAVAGTGIGFEIFEALVKDFAVPIRNRNRLRCGRDAVPQRLQVVDLLVDRQLVETGRREGNGFWHGSTSSRMMSPSIPRGLGALPG